MDSCPAAPFSLGAVRKCQHGEWITYSATLETRGAEAVHALLDRLENAGLCTPHLRFGSPDVYAVLGTIYTDEGMFSGDQASRPRSNSTGSTRHSHFASDHRTANRAANNAWKRDRT